jgi:hypothetical protein
MNRQLFSFALGAFLAASCPAAIASGPEKPATDAGKAPVYRCMGFDEPLHRSPMEVEKGRVLPLRVKLAGPGDTFALGKDLQAPPTVHLVQLTDSGEEDRADSLDVRDYGKNGQFVPDQEAHWKLDLGTNPLEDGGRYKVTVLSGDEKAYRVEPTCELVFTLRSGR